MITNKNFESNARRLARYIVKHCNDADVLLTGIIVIDVSESLFSDFKKDYEKEVNKHLDNKGVKVIYGRTSREDGCSLVFGLEYDDVDAETEDW